MANVFTDTAGDIKAMLRIILNAPEFYASAANRIKRPLQFIASALRALHADTFGHGLVSYLNQMGQGLFEYPTPDGYPEDSAFWLGSLVFRWNFALALAANSLPGVSVSLPRLSRAVGGADPDRAQIFAYLTGRRPTKNELAALGQQESAQLYGLILASPAFQRC